MDLELSIDAVKILHSMPTVLPNSPRSARRTSQTFSMFVVVSILKEN